MVSREYKIITAEWGNSDIANQLQSPLNILMEKVNAELQKGGVCLGGPTFTTIEGEYGTRWGVILQGMMVIK